MKSPFYSTHLNSGEVKTGGAVSLEGTHDLDSADDDPGVESRARSTRWRLRGLVIFHGNKWFSKFLFNHHLPRTFPIKVSHVTSKDLCPSLSSHSPPLQFIPAFCEARFLTCCSHIALGTSLGRYSLLSF